VDAVNFKVRYYRAICGLIFFGFGMLFLLQAANGFGLGWVFSAACVAFVLRAYLLGVVLEEDTVRVRSWLYTRRIPLAEVAAFEVVPYSGAWARGGSIFWLDQLLIVRVNGTENRIPAIIGLRRGKAGIVESIARQLNQLAGRAPRDPVEPTSHRDRSYVPRRRPWH
jgi:hypothetical protein